MKENCPSVTALIVAVHRAAHQIMDKPNVFSDPLALRILGEDHVSAQTLDPKWLEFSPLSSRLRPFLAARSRYTEYELHRAVKRGVQQYVVLGAGLDTFAYRNPYTEDILHVFEVDHPATQSWKRTRLEKAGIPIPQTLTFSPVDFENQTLEEGLTRADFDTGKCTFFSWLGVTQYLTSSAVMATLQFVASLPVGSGIVFDYTISPLSLNSAEREIFDSLAHRVALAGEPFQTFYDPSLLTRDLRAVGFQDVEDLGPQEMNARYFKGRQDKLKVDGFTHIMNARI